MLAMSMMLGGLPVYEITLSSNRAQWQKSVDAPQVPSNVPVNLILRVSSAIEIQSTSTSVAAIYVDQLAAGSQFYLINAGYVLGKGGVGGAGGTVSGNGGTGGDGGDAVRLNFNGFAQITNGSGRIWGGGGGGGGGGSCQAWRAGDSVYEFHAVIGGGGGGGGGAGGGAAGAAGTGANAGTAGTTGSAGTNGTGGNGGHSGQSGAGNAGGAFGAAGTAGGSGNKHGGPSDGSLSNGGVAGASGYAIRHDSGTTVSFISGAVSPNVKGSVST